MLLHYLSVRVRLSYFSVREEWLRQLHWLNPFLCYAFLLFFFLCAIFIFMRLRERERE